MRKNLERLIKLLVYSSFFVPLVVVPSSFIFPFIVPKVLLFRSLVTIMLVAYILLLITNWQAYKPKLTALNITLFAFLLSFTISTFVGTDPYHSFWDNHERMLGLFTIFHYIAYYFICSSVFKEWKEWKWVLRVFLFAGSIVAIIGLVQVINPEFLLNKGSIRVSSTLGNAIYLGGYGLFLTFLAFLLFVRDNNKYWRVGYLLMGLLSITATFYSGTRGSMLGLLAGVGVLFIGYFIILKEHKKTRIALGAIIVLGIILLGILYAYRQTDFVKNMPAVGRAINTSWTDVKNTPRWIAWEISIESWKERPVFGWGPNNYFYAFNLHYNPRSLEYGYGETWFDNAHNIIMNTLAVQGAFGLIVYLSIFVIASFTIWQFARKKDMKHKHLCVVSIAFLMAHLVQNITVFENITSYLYFMLWLALISSMAGNKQKKNSGKTVPDKRIGSASLLISALAIILVIYVFNIQPAKANTRTLIAMRLLSSNPASAFSQLQPVLESSSPHVDDIRSDLARTVHSLVSQYSNQIGKEGSLKVLDQVYDALYKNLELHPLDIRNHMVLSQIAQTKAIIIQDPEYVFEREKLIEDALKKSPKRQQIIYVLAETKIRLNKKEEAFKLFDQALSDNPRIGETYWRIAYAHMLFGEYDKAQEALDLGYKNGAIFTENDKNAIKELSAYPSFSGVSVESSVVAEPDN
ncbi:MAG: O-antigen ligase family protein [bacterium]